MVSFFARAMFRLGGVSSCLGAEDIGIFFVSEVVFLNFSRPWLQFWTVVALSGAVEVAEVRLETSSTVPSSDGARFKPRDAVFFGRISAFWTGSETGAEAATSHLCAVLSFMSKNS